MYEQFKNLQDEFMEEDKLHQLFHWWDTNAVKGFNKLITKFLPKDRTFCKTNENLVRIHLAMCLLSIGYEETYRRLFHLTGLSLGEFNHIYLLAEDQQRRWQRKRRKKLPVKTIRMSNQYKKLREDGKKMIDDRERELTYESGMMGPGGGGSRARTRNNNKKSENRNLKKDVHVAASRLTSK